jgi:hypothetical protein
MAKRSYSDMTTLERDSPMPPIKRCHLSSSTIDRITRLRVDQEADKHLTQLIGKQKEKMNRLSTEITHVDKQLEPERWKELQQEIQCTEQEESVNGYLFRLADFLSTPISMCPPVGVPIPKVTVHVDGIPSKYPPIEISRTSDIYWFEGFLQWLFPDNRNVRPMHKIYVNGNHMKASLTSMITTVIPLQIKYQPMSSDASAIRGCYVCLAGRETSKKI